MYVGNADDESRMREEDLRFSRVSRSSFRFVARFLFLRERETKKKEEGGGGDDDALLLFILAIIIAIA